ncbi:MAG: hypothetical protein ACT4QG_03720 [Sporichthyaceae bacterium]
MSADRTFSGDFYEDDEPREVVQARLRRPPDAVSAPPSGDPARDAADRFFGISLSMPGVRARLAGLAGPKRPVLVALADDPVSEFWEAADGRGPVVAAVFFPGDEPRMHFFPVLVENGAPSDVRPEDLRTRGTTTMAMVVAWMASANEGFEVPAVWSEEVVAPIAQ